MRVERGQRTRMVSDGRKESAMVYGQKSLGKISKWKRTKAKKSTVGTQGRVKAGRVGGCWEENTPG